jgi:hypothetical protein
MLAADPSIAVTEAVEMLRVFLRKREAANEEEIDPTLVQHQSERRVMLAALHCSLSPPLRQPKLLGMMLLPLPLTELLSAALVCRTWYQTLARSGPTAKTFWKKFLATSPQECDKRRGAFWIVAVRAFAGVEAWEGMSSVMNSYEALAEGRSVRNGGSSSGSGGGDSAAGGAKMETEAVVASLEREVIVRPVGRYPTQVNVLAVKEANLLAVNRAKGGNAPSDLATAPSDLVTAPSDLVTDLYPTDEEDDAEADGEDREETETIFNRTFDPNDSPARWDMFNLFSLLSSPLLSSPLLSSPLLPPLLSSPLLPPLPPPSHPSLHSPLPSLPSPPSPFTTFKVGHICTV